MQLLDRWVALGTVPPGTDRIRLSGEGTAAAAIVRDRFGNGLGGVRHALGEVPVTSYNQSGPCSGRDSREAPFDWRKLSAIYVSYDAFARLFGAAVDVEGRTPNTSFRRGSVCMALVAVLMEAPSLLS